MFHEGTCNLDEYNIIGIGSDFIGLCIGSSLDLKNDALPA
jgi:hypothetical protein